MTFGYREIYNELVAKHNDINLSMVRRIKLKILKLPETRVKKFVTKRVTTANNQHQKRMYMMT